MDPRFNNCYTAKVGFPRTVSYNFIFFCCREYREGAVLAETGVEEEEADLAEEAVVDLAAEEEGVADSADGVVDSVEAAVDPLVVHPKTRKSLLIKVKLVTAAILIPSSSSKWA